MRVAGQCHALATLPLGKETGSLCTGPVWTGAENLSPTGIRSLNHATIATRQTSPPNRVRKRIFGEMYRGINKFKKGHQPRINIVKFEKGDLLANSRNISKGGRITSLSY